MSTERSPGTFDESLPWAAPREGVLVERRDPWAIVIHGAWAGLLAGLTLGLVEIVASAVLQGYARYPFDFAAGLLLGNQAFAPEFSAAASVILGTVIHVLLSVVLGIIFVAVLALAFQLSARPWLLVIYGMVYGLVIWEVSFLALLPLLAPELTGRVDVGVQLWNGIASYSLVYGPTLALYVAVKRPGVLDKWWKGGPETP